MLRVVVFEMLSTLHAGRVEELNIDLGALGSDLTWERILLQKEC